MRKKIIVGNWKMNKTNAETREYIRAFRALLRPADLERATIALCVPFTAVSLAAELLRGSGVWTGAQNMHFETAGAFTGEISAAMLRDAGARCVILGYSERRRLYGETFEDVNIKVLKSLSERLAPIVCVGETIEQREAFKTEAVVKAQVAAALQRVPAEWVQNVIIAYEPVWAIGTGRCASVSEAAGAATDIRSMIREMHGGETAEAVNIIYGGSMNAANAAALLEKPEIDGGFIGRGSLKPSDFYDIINCV